MCGIIGYVGHRPAVPVILQGLRRLEYRGYDSAGVAYMDGQELRVVRSPGKLSALEQRLSTVNFMNSTCAIGHTRWATHGLPTEKNAHPHMDQMSRMALVHNGIIENYLEIRDRLQGLGLTFDSETDTEVLAKLIGHELDATGSIPHAISRALKQVEGAYAFALICNEETPTIWAARKSSPLLFGAGTGENFVASDIPAFLQYTREVVFLEDGELVQLTDHDWKVFDSRTLKPVAKQTSRIEWEVQAAEKGGFRHFMLKEIFEQPQVIRDCLRGRVRRNGRVTAELRELKDWPVPSRLHIVACGTSYHAGLWAKYLMEEWARIPVDVEIASEFRYRPHVFLKGDAILAISQSGETADTLAGMRIAKECNVPVMGLCNVVGSSVFRESDLVITTQAGPEISVASTKAMCSQQVLLLLMALYWGGRRGIVPQDTLLTILDGLTSLPEMLDEALPGMRERASELAREYAFASSCFYLGRGRNFPLAMEGALKLKEISYIHAEGYAAGEMKHGPIALIEPDFPTFAIVTEDDLMSKMMSNLQEVRARDGRIVILTDSPKELEADHVWRIPRAEGPLKNFFVLPALQLFAYEMAVYLGQDVDQPRNLAKSVTVE
ncbi:MAG: glutamine--fructose-6-phosphate transaminase (isomerizing) [Deltaproteobacteria bacterium]|nr:glutamine--fructose-6-phosphate transaminase (isomerizing) [Deltaproteobacteria bacterium]